MKNKSEQNIVGNISRLGIEKFQTLGAVVKGMDPSHRAALAACTVAGGFALLRLGFTDGLQGAVVSVGLLVVDAGIVMHLHLEAKKHWERYEAWRGRCEGREQKQHALNAAESALQLNREAREKVDSDIREIEDELRLRERLNFDVARISMAAAAAAREGYLSGVDSNKGRYAA